MKHFKNAMNKFHITVLALAGITLFVSCSDDDNAPEPVNEEEVITTMNVTLAASGGTIPYSRKI